MQQSGLSERICREKWMEGLGNCFLQCFGSWHELDSRACWETCPAPATSGLRECTGFYCLSVLSFCMPSCMHVRWNTESDLGKCAILVKIIRTARIPVHRSEPWWVARANIKPGRSFTLGVKQEKRAGSRHWTSPEIDRAAIVSPFPLASNMSLSPLSSWEFTSCLWSALKDSLFACCWLRYSACSFSMLFSAFWEDFM